MIQLDYPFIITDEKDLKKCIKCKKNINFDDDYAFIHIYDKDVPITADNQMFRYLCYKNCYDIYDEDGNDITEFKYLKTPNKIYNIDCITGYK